MVLICALLILIFHHTNHNHFYAVIHQYLHFMPYNKGNERIVELFYVIKQQCQFHQSGCFQYKSLVSQRGFFFYINFSSLSCFHIAAYSNIKAGSDKEKE
jgi:hypothetical protein